MSHITYTPLAKSGVGGVTPANGKNLLALLVTRLALAVDVDGPEQTPRMDILGSH